MRLPRRVLVESFSQFIVFAPGGFQIEDQILQPQPQRIQRLLKVAELFLEQIVAFFGLLGESDDLVLIRGCYTVDVIHQLK